MLTELHSAVADTPNEIRTGEPLEFGLPFPEGALSDTSTLALRNNRGESVPLQWRVLDRWPSDGSIRWAAFDCQLDVPGACTLHSVPATRQGTPPLDIPAEPSAGGQYLFIAPVRNSYNEAHGGPNARHARAIGLTSADDGWHVRTAGMVYTVKATTNELFAVRDQSNRSRSVVLRILGEQRQEHAVQFVQRSVEIGGPIRTTLRLDGVVGSQESPLLRIVARLSWFAGLHDVRVELTIHNPRRARHSGGYWELGDSGSFYFTDASLMVICPEGHDSVLLSEDTEHELEPITSPVLVHQESSGGEHWRSPVHVNRRGRIPLRFRGYQVRGAGVFREGDRATPVLTARKGGTSTAAAIAGFWQNFPKALEATAEGLRASVFPGEAGDVHELQGGEQKTHVVGFAFAEGSVATRPLEWIVRPAVAHAEPEWYCVAKALPYLTTAAADPHARYLDLVKAAIDGPHSFDRKRELVDEYGWRNFGDLFADHESAYKEEGPPFVSHYNNQYDAVGGFATQFMRSGDPRWWTAMDQLARHVVDIDIYHATGDKSAYSGGLFWHTAHYVDAGRSSHRAYPRAPGVPGGGPSNEHCYSTGLMLYFFLTGHDWARAAVVGLASWVLQIDSGHLTPFRWLSRGPTGLASSTFSPGHHGPGRGAGNAIVTLLNGFRLTQDRAFLRKAEELIRRCIHPSDDVGMRGLLDAERRWSYTVFLQALGRYLDEKAVLGELDCGYAYARSSLLGYAHWMAHNEYPYLEKPEILEFPTETWAAQDMRKSEVLTVASRYAAPQDRVELLERAEYFFNQSLDWLSRFPSRFYTRPVVILLSCGYIRAAAARGQLPDAPEPAVNCNHGVPQRFRPQKYVAVQRAKRGAVILAITAAVWVVTQLVSR